MLRLEWTSGNYLVRPPCSKESQLEKVSQDYVQSSSEYLQDWKLHNISGQFVPAFDDCILICIHCLFSHWALLRRVCSLSLHSSGIYRHCSDITELSLLHAEQSQLSQLLSVRCSKPLIIFVALHWACSRTPMSVFYWHAQELA